MSTGLQRLTDNVWLWPHDPDPATVRACVGVVAGTSGSIVVDAGQSPAMAREVRAAVDATGLPPARLLVLTHHHWDHTWGVAEWGVPVLAHERCAELLATDAALPWSHEYLRAEMDREPLLKPSYTARSRAVDDFGELRIVVPDRTFTDRVTITEGGVTVHVEHVGGQHTPDSTVVRVPGDGVLFLGDSYYPPPYHLRSAGDDVDVALLTSLISDDIEWYVESHDVPRRRADLLRLLGE
ncbi:glyoxylase-like metal-dependent hydrolase (beta-lactamase superfamily II) [Haloactinopolyspora alba]|uniref:Glyoxylase-like metal-dependent hydrolase (Beta-lactamase superfamily II) n=1 Tax=Haloactinopolyspora alba TaxID=648780 RepID=A0A2P8EBE4_9ACTN|nr:MBL fold metallo-hydrolase [Haloactinopolyspora alba]PSL06791.1 glyoxylase-like metal-dependent hydrolase (beta-lactamase superfamily II) [Haloactinopolyspora alba]